MDDLLVKGVDQSTQKVVLSSSEIDQLTAASATGNVGALKTFFSQWQSKLLSDQFPLETLCPLLFTAVRNNQVATVAYFLDQGVPMNQELFLYATESKSYQMLQVFLEHGWDINTPVDSLRPPALAYTFDDEALVNWFLDHGADPNAPCGRDCTPLSWAMRYASFSTLQLLFNRGGTILRGQLLHHAAERELSDRLDALKFVLEIGGLKSINNLIYQDSLDDYLMNMYSGLGTPLQLAAGKGSLDLVKLLVDRGADPLIKDPTGQIALRWAIRRGHTEVAEFLRPLSIPSIIPRHDFSDGPGLHFKPMPLQDFLKLGGWDAVSYPPP
ncbi:hypothetical protein DTO271G3_7460 [Paecilomyces variotii]|nr:hypothetical protein DTO271G3_7460 [Paecilomyces variotii]